MPQTKYIKGMLYQEFAARVLQNTAPEILEEQHQRVYQYYNFRTGSIGARLSTQAAKVRKMAGGAVLEFDYAIDLRFLDIKKTKHGKKKVYGPVYNRPLWGYVYGYIFNTLRYGLSAKVQQEIFDEIRASVEKLDRRKIHAAA